MKRGGWRIGVAAVLCSACVTGCGTDSGGSAKGSGGASNTDAAAGSGGTTGAGGNTTSGGAASGGTTASGDGTSGGAAGATGGATARTDGGTNDAGSGTVAIGEWVDAPGVCPPGMPEVDLTTADELASASRGEDAYANDAPATCYLIKNGVYAQSGVTMYVLKGGVAGAARRFFIGESRSGVILHARANVEDGVSDVTIANLTFDLTGYTAGGAFNTLNLGSGKNVTVDHVTFTGDCNTGLQGGHIETNRTQNVLIDACLIEKFGHCSGGGHLDHGVYLASGSHITIHDSVIRGNSSRGIQMYTANGQYGTLDTIDVDHCRIYENGHADFEDGIVINSADTGTIENVTLTHNLIYRNYYSGIRFVGGAEGAVTVNDDTFDSNGAGSTLASRSEVNLDAVGAGAGTLFSNDLFDVGNALINDCYDATSLGFTLGKNFVHGPIPVGPKGNCVTSGQVTGDPSFVNAPAGDHRPGNPAAANFGAYAP